ncbi:hypothetical protein [Salegentibacter salarius]|uniref:Uncharacterized protein n=1 Tax=Salegentibacter salarius TaxID=435906 RepID=A0A2N0TRF2_9FLAO|nr:hypothetical protein [Salegentibacter salarius]OEY71966.1 hypothetical protein BHS39_14710 [Salegentibacter salarius]PKD17322.1 hypothetical protein APR40_14680 [Salegentibacter salarius]SLK05599.1 hypothetical protein SAMN05660445_03025 [Salegentibacter salarius]
MFKQELLDYIREAYKELNNLEVVMDGKSMQGSLYNLLTPYLAHTNSLDEYARVISFYTQEGSRQQKLLPLYIALSNYYKTFNDLKSSYSEEALHTENLEENLEKLNGALPETFSYLGKKWRNKFLSIDISRNNRVHFYIESIERRPRRIAPKIQDILPHLRKNIQDFEEYNTKLSNFQIALDKFIEKNKAYIQFEEYSNISTIGIHEILKLGRTINKKPESGVLLFTNKTKYLKLIEDTEFNSKAVSENFPIAEIIVSRDGELEVVQKKFSGSSPIIYICSIEYYAGWEVLLEDLNIDYVNTIIIDDLDELLKKEKSREYYYFKEFTASVKNAQLGDRLKDVYFLQKDYNFLQHKFLETLGMNLYPWLINHAERNFLSKRKNDEGVNHQVYAINDDLGAKFWERFKSIVLHLRFIMFNENILDNRVKYLTFLNEGYTLLSRITSFYNEDIRKDLENYLKIFSSNLDLFNSVSFNNKVESLREVINLYPLSNPKIEILCQILNRNNHLKKVAIVSKNNSELDFIYVRNKLKNFQTLEISFFQLENITPKELKPFDAVFFLNFSGKLTTSIFLTYYSRNQYLILNNRAELGYYKKCFREFTPIITDISDFTNKLLILNLEHQESLIEKSTIEFVMSDYIVYEEPELETIEVKEEDVEDFIETDDSENIEEQDFSFILEKLVNNTPGTNRITEFNTQERDNILLIFQDSFLKVPSSKYFHILEEEGVDSIRDIKKRASEIQAGDKVFLLQDFNNDFNDLLFHLKKHYPRLNSFYDKGNAWRVDLYSKYVECGGYISRLNKYLNSQGIKVTDPTVERWISGLTIVPECLDQLVDLFKREESNQSFSFDKTEILEAANWLGKFRTSLHKEIFLYHIYKKYNMEHQINNLDLKNLISKMDGIVEIKEVLMINKAQNANSTTVPIEIR